MKIILVSREYSGFNLFDPENPDYSIDLSDNELNDELEDEHECQEDEHYEFLYCSETVVLVSLIR